MNHPTSEIRTLAFVGVLTLISSGNRAAAQVVYSLQQLPAGTIVVDAEADRFNRLILRTRPVVASGDIDRLPSGLEQSVSLFSYTILATVSNSPLVPAADPPASESSAAASANSGATEYRLHEVGLGYSTPVGGRQVIVSASQASANSNFGIIDLRVLDQNETNLRTARVVVRSSTLMMFDLAVILAREGGNQQEQVRNLIWIDPRSGRSAMAIWVVEQRAGRGPNQSWTVGDEPIQLHPGGSRVDNRLYVDGNTFLLGIPTTKTFGSEKLLPGRRIAWTETLRQLAGKASYSPETLARLTEALNGAIRGTPPAKAH